MKKIFKNDEYRIARGGYSRLLAVACRKCGGRICLYQKNRGKTPVPQLA